MPPIVAVSCAIAASAERQVRTMYKIILIIIYFIIRFINCKIVFLIMVKLIGFYESNGLRCDFMRYSRPVILQEWC